MSELIKKINQLSVANEAGKTVRVLIICGAVVAVASFGVDFNIGLGG